MPSLGGAKISRYACVDCKYAQALCASRVKRRACALFRSVGDRCRRVLRDSGRRAGAAGATEFFIDEEGHGEKKREKCGQHAANRTPGKGFRLQQPLRKVKARVEEHRRKSYPDESPRHRLENRISHIESRNVLLRLPRDIRPGRRVFNDKLRKQPVQRRQSGVDVSF